MFRGLGASGNSVRVFRGLGASVNSVPVFRGLAASVNSVRVFRGLVLPSTVIEETKPTYKRKCTDSVR